jgi:hypothetical protein
LPEGTDRKMSFVQLARKYLSELQHEWEIANRSKQATPELSYRPVLDKFFRNLASSINPEIEQVFEPKAQRKSGRPDWRFHNSKSLGVYGYIDSKGFDPKDPLNDKSHVEQIKKYLKLGSRVALTDGVDFHFYDPQSSSATRISLTDKPIRLKDWGSLPINPLFERQIRVFFKDAAARKVSEEVLIEDVALRAQFLSKDILELADLDPKAGTTSAEKKTIRALRELKRILEEHHDDNLRSAKMFSDFVAQVLAFGLVYAHRVVARSVPTPTLRYEKIQLFWSNAVQGKGPDHLRPFVALVKILKDELDAVGPIGTWYQDILLLLSHIDLDEEQQNEPDYHKLFELFFEKFDPQTRFDYGAFYTPKHLVKFVVNLANAVVEERFESRSLYETGNKLIDPCSGTGTFIEELLNYNPDRSHLPTIAGFEVLPAPYALSYYRMSMIKGKGGFPKNTSILLTNTLSDELEKTAKTSTASNLLTVEQDNARKIAKPPITLIIGNPPSSDSPPVLPNKENFKLIQELLDDFRPPAEDRVGRQNIQKQTQNAFVMFLRWTCGKLQVSTPSVMALVLPSSLAEHASYAYVRKWLYEHFNQLWILDLDTDRRRGVSSDSLFKTLQGRLLLCGLKTDGSGRLPELHYATIADYDLNDKIEYLEKDLNAKQLLKLFSAFDPDVKDYSLRPGRKAGASLYDRFWPLYPEASTPKDGERYVFERHCSCVKMAPTALLVHEDKDLLLRRCRDVGQASTDLPEVLGKWFKGQKKPPSQNKITDSVRHALKESCKTSSHVSRYAFRPFLTVYAVLSEKVFYELSRQKNSGTRMRPEIKAAYDDRKTIGIAVAPATRDIGETLHRFSSFCWDLPDNELCTRGNAHVFCNQFPEYKKASWDPKPKDNIHSGLSETLAKSLGLKKDEARDLLVYYAYAVLCSESYMEKFSSQLFTVAKSSNRLRIPMTADRRLFRKIADKGRELADLENPDNDFISPGMKGQAELFPGPFRLNAFKLSVSDGAISLISDGGVAATVTGLPKVTLELKIAGNEVVSTWLKWHSYAYTRKEFDKEAFMGLLSLASKIEKQVEVIGEIDSSVMELVSDKDKLL